MQGGASVSLAVQRGAESPAGRGREWERAILGPERIARVPQRYVHHARLESGPFQPITRRLQRGQGPGPVPIEESRKPDTGYAHSDRKSTRLNSSHAKN